MKKQIIFINMEFFTYDICERTFNSTVDYKETSSNWKLLNGAIIE